MMDNIIQSSHGIKEPERCSKCPHKKLCPQLQEQYQIVKEMLDRKLNKSGWYYSGNNGETTA